MPEVTGTLKVPRLASAPSSPVQGQVYYNTTDKLLRYWNGTSWIAEETKLGWINFNDYVALYGGGGTNTESEAAGNSNAMDAALAAAGAVAAIHTVGHLWVGPGTYRFIRGHRLPNGVRIHCAGVTATFLIPAAAFVCNDPASYDKTYLFRNADVTGGQEFCGIEDCSILGGGDYSVTNIDSTLIFDTMGGNYVLRNVYVYAPYKKGIWLRCTAAGLSCGPMGFDHVWCQKSYTDHNVVIDGGVVATVWLNSEMHRPGIGKAGIALLNPPTEKANGRHTFLGTYIESRGASDTPPGDGSAASQTSFYIQNHCNITIIGLSGPPVVIDGDSVDDGFGSTHIIIQNQAVYPTATAIFDNARSTTVAGPRVTRYETNPPVIITDAIVDGVTTVAPSQNAVFDALALKLGLTAQAADSAKLGGTLAAAFLQLHAGVASGFDLDQFQAITVVQATTTDLVSLRQHYVGGLALLMCERAADGSNTYFAIIGFKNDFAISTVTKIYESGWSSGGYGAPTFTMSAAGTGAKAIKVNQPTGIGNTTWRGLVFSVRTS